MSVNEVLIEILGLSVHDCSVRLAEVLCERDETLEEISHGWISSCGAGTKMGLRDSKMTQPELEDEIAKTLREILDDGVVLTLSCERVMDEQPGLEWRITLFLQGPSRVPISFSMLGFEAQACIQALCQNRAFRNCEKDIYGNRCEYTSFAHNDAFGNHLDRKKIALCFLRRLARGQGTRARERISCAVSQLVPKYGFLLPVQLYLQRDMM